MWKTFVKKLISKRLWALMVAAGLWITLGFFGGWKLATSGSVMTFMGVVWGAFLAAEGVEKIRDGKVEEMRLTAEASIHKDNVEAGVAVDAVAKDDNQPMGFGL